ncbi:hypothetical protein AAMO2058_000634600 [Amorphochlora amoebiformis]
MAALTRATLSLHGRRAASRYPAGIRMMSDASLAERARALGVKYLLISFDDLFGTTRSKLIPTTAAESVETDGAGFAGFAAHFDMTPADPDMLAIPDPSTLVKLPWDKEIGWVASNLVVRGQPLLQGPRNRLKDMCDDLLESRGLVLKTGVECEFFLLNKDSIQIADGYDTASKPCYDQSALMRQRGFVCELNDAMQEMGFPPYQTDHEDANGQFECNWHYDHALTTADRHCLFKFTAKSLAAKYGMRATFMPKPFSNLTGNGCHVHVTLHCAKNNDINIFKSGKSREDATDLLSETGKYFVGGLLAHARGLCAITNPSVNSYKRLSAPVTASGATWAPATATWAGNNRSHMIRIPDAPRIEFRLPDMSANPYLLPSGILAAGMLGVDGKVDPGKPSTENAYASGTETKEDAITLPANLLDSLRALEDDKKLCRAIGKECTDALVKLRKVQWGDYTRHLTKWELTHTLDC